MKFIKFLVKAKIATYASEGEENEIVLEDGAKELTFKDKNFRYRDRYFGSNPFSGEEVVFKNNIAIWVMNYYGDIHSKIAPIKEVTNFLKKSMKLVKENRPFRGPTNFKEGNYEYKDKSQGTIDKFKGIEQIFYKGKEIYRLEYHGGIIKFK